MSSQPPLESGATGRRADDALRSFGRRSSGITFAVMITVLLVALIFAANQNDVIGWIIVAISAGWLILAGILVMSVRRGAQKVGQTLDSARADAAARHTGAGGTAIVDEDAHSRNMKLDHSFKIVQVQRRVIVQELAKGEEADLEMVERALETIEMTAANGRDMLADHVGRGGEDRRRTDDDRPISGEVVD
ncbi:hypothetical protein [Nesterenkonia sp. HG001]|uniref:hypothetical protein n=1 Tax=Nesterenkonia sp. HG001 TaxID=2983207 RepID=UPI002AC6B2D4|nr:hypothetical protein [Nesterenkonia sp. HG001]MDZ5076862.1 hypothetical protein [Nesterenkonia sp. HG001]